MNIAIVSLIFFVATILIGICAKVNCGMVAMISSLILALFFMPDMSLADVYVKGWPVKIFFMMLAVLLLFGIANANGTMEIVAKRLIRLVHGRSKIMPFFLFGVTFVLAATGAGPGIAPMILPIAFSICLETGLSCFMMAVIINCAASAGGLSPISTSGILIVGFMEQIGVGGYAKIYIGYILLMLIESIFIYFVRGGFRAKRAKEGGAAGEIPKMNRYQKITLAVILVVILGVIVLKLDISMLAIAGAAFLMLVGAITDRKAIGAVNWNTLMLVAGMFMLITLVQACGGLELLASLLTKVMSPRTSGGIMALLAGLLATVASASGVVMPTLIPLSGEIAAMSGGTIGAALLTAGVILGGNAAFFSPFSVLGSLTLALYPEKADRDKVFVRHLQMTFASIAFITILCLLGFHKLLL